MGCDIHLTVEQKLDTPRVIPGKKEVTITWEALPKPERFRNKNDYDPKEWYGGRNYNLFAILANVRNGIGFAGIKTGDGLTPILPENAGDISGHLKKYAPEPYCRGVPKDASLTFRKNVASMGIDGHSHSWIHLSELRAYDWDQTSKHRGYIHINEYFEWKEKKGRPSSYSGGISGPQIECVSMEEADALISSGKVVFDPDPKHRGPFGDMKAKPGETKYYVDVKWESTYADAAGDFYSTTLMQLVQYAEEEKINDDNLRIAFFFDN